MSGTFRNNNKTLGVSESRVMVAIQVDVLCGPCSSGSVPSGPTRITRTSRATRAPWGPGKCCWLHGRGGCGSTEANPGNWVPGMVLFRLKIKEPQQPASQKLFLAGNLRLCWSFLLGVCSYERTSYAFFPLQGPIGFRGPPGIPGAPGKVVCMYLGWKVDFTPAKTL